MTPSRRNVGTARRSLSARRGAAAVAMVVLMLLLGLVLIGMVLGGARHQDLSVHRLDAVRAFYAAEAGLNMAMREVALEVDFDGDGIVGGIASGTGASIFGSASAAVTADTDGSLITLTSMGQSAPGIGASGVQSRRRLRSTVVRSPSLMYRSLAASYYASADAPSLLADIDWDATPSAVAIARQLNWPPTSNSNRFWVGGPQNNYGARFRGLIHVPQTGLWTFFTASDDGSRLWINGEEVVDNDGVHGMRTRSGSIDLEAGWHEFEVRYFERSSDHGLIVSWSGPGVPAQTVIPESAFAHTEEHLHQPIPRIAVRETMDLAGQGPGAHCFMDNFDSGQGGYGGTNISTDDFISTNKTSGTAITLSRATLYGHVRVGPGGNPNNMIRYRQNGVILGTVGALTSPITIPQVIVPAGLPANSGNSTPSGTSNLVSNFHYANWEIGNNVTVNITAPIVGRLSGNLAMEGSGRINITGNGSLTLYVYGSVQLANTASINANTGDPRRVRIYMMDQSQSISLSRQSAIVADISNPEGSLVLSGQASQPQSHVIGSVFVRELHMSNRTQLHGDVPTVNATANAGGAVAQTWVEISPNGTP